MFSYFEDILANRHEHARKLKKEKDKKLIAYMCSYVPEEIIYAAGGIPVRMLTSEEFPTLAETFMQSYYCTFSRSILHEGLAGNYDYADGVVNAYSCVNMRLAFDNLHREGKFPYSRFLYMPGIIDGPDAKEFYYKELQRFRKDMEDLFGRKVTDDDLREAIQIYDKNRSLILQIYEGRKENPPNISGKEAYLLSLSSMLTDKAEHNIMLEKLIAELPKREPLEAGINRVMFVGSPVDNLKLLEIVEDDVGAWVVADDTCTGTRYLWGTTPTDLVNEDPIKAIVQRYLVSRPPCPSKHAPTRFVQCKTCPFRTTSCFVMEPTGKQKLPEGHPFATPERICRFRHALTLGINNKVEGVIAVVQKFCDPHGFDYHHVVQAFEDVGIPSVFIEIDNVVSIGQVKTRVQAFIEMVQPVDYLIEPEIRAGIQI